MQTVQHRQILGELLLRPSPRAFLYLYVCHLMHTLCRLVFYVRVGRIPCLLFHCWAWRYLASLPRTIHAHVTSLDRWIKAPAQALAHLDNNEDILAHPAGDYVLEQLQHGVPATEVLKLLLET